MLDDGNPDCLPSGLVNFEKMYMLSKVISRIQECQRTPYFFTVEMELHNYLSQPPILSESDLYEISLKWEPKVVAISPPPIPAERPKCNASGVPQSLRTALPSQQRPGSASLVHTNDMAGAPKRTSMHSTLNEYATS